ncbi:A/G-specific adenine glycosylase [Pullulanibacillus sp. KACC 23026]|uniref:A/G-specific adenine glycosylase n=1 Tax=Pullulanibacillus sp. KACC 23026 TaxID=3028315 RepID=UPI0023B0A810|nr:A/G-specific adenine glycosylase [Pullulanibacillus sp. KACC 23026]WEG12274.1 A/G-specific adenine glycosylase [Pullulanibacillus sp. KACC 23026]
MTLELHQNHSILVSASLVDWYRKNQRDLPWRNMHNPYYTWISEVMLQQTQVDTVIPYYERFKSRFPTMQSLAYADEEDVLKSWEGLGYYSRARNLQAGVREVVEQYGGVVPKDRSTLLKIKGIGPYTSGAILSIAYNLPVPAVDGNVMRVLSRLFLIKEDIAKPKTRQVFEKLLDELIPNEAASDFNQGIMELGALICKPKNPLCEECPISQWCQAKQQDIQESLPIKSKKAKQKTEAYRVLWLKDASDRVLVHKRSESGLLANLWEFPMISHSEHSDESHLNSYVAEMLSLKKPLTLNKVNQSVSHTFSHLKWELNLWEGTLLETSPCLPNSFKWVTIKELHEIPIPVSHQKIRELMINSKRAD